MRRNRYIRLAKATFLVAAGFALSGCLEDSFDVGKKPPPDGSVSLNIALPTPASKNMTRSVPDGFGRIDDMNVVIATGTGDASLIQTILWVDNLTVGTINSDHGLVEYTDRGTVHFDKEWLEYRFIDVDTSAFFVIANNGSRIPDVTTVADLRALKIRDNQFVMFGRSVDVTDTAHTGQTDHGDGRSLRVELKRLTAMITVKIDGSGLGSGVIVYPQRISLHNVPSYCLLDDDNNVTGVDAYNSPLEDPLSPTRTSIIADGQSFDATAWGDMTGTTNSVVGGHYTDWEWEEGQQPTGVDYGNAAVQSLFMYENYHGTGFGAPNAVQSTKRPFNASTDEADIEARSKACAYIRVDARYYNGGSATARYGDVVYRVFLGSDVFENFDVMRNTYYRLTLSLNNTAIGEGDASWRLDTNLGSIEFSDSDIIINGGGEMVDIGVVDTGGNQANTPIEYDTNGDGIAETNYTQRDANPGGGDWIYVYHGDEDEWITLEDIDKFPFTDGSRTHVFLFIAPMIRDVTWFGPANQHVRQVTFRMRQASGGTVTPWLTLTQYEPIAITIDTGVPTQEISDYAVNTLGWTLPRTLLFDRHDAGQDLPWGFDGVQISANGASGLANGYALTQAPYTATANGYLPLGKPGSAMMHAQFMRYFQRAAAVDPPTTIGQIETYTPPAGYPADFFIPSVAEWRLLEMLDDAGVEVYDPSWPITPWDAYWTSDAVTDAGLRDTYGYRMGQSDNNAVGPIPRTTPTRYRMMYFLP